MLAHGALGLGLPLVLAVLGGCLNDSQSGRSDTERTDVADTTDTAKAPDSLLADAAADANADGNDTSSPNTSDRYAPFHAGVVEARLDVDLAVDLSLPHNEVLWAVNGPGWLIKSVGVDGQGVVRVGLEMLRDALPEPIEYVGFNLPPIAYEAFVRPDNRCSYMAADYCAAFCPSGAVVCGGLDCSRLSDYSDPLSACGALTTHVVDERISEPTQAEKDQGFTSVRTLRSVFVEEIRFDRESGALSSVVVAVGLSRTLEGDTVPE